MVFDTESFLKDMYLFSNSPAIFIEVFLEFWVEISKILVELSRTRDISKNQKQSEQSKAIEFSIQQDLYNVIYSKKQ